VEAQESAAQDMMAVTGIRFDATKSERIADESGIALAHLRQNSELGSYHYIDNFSRSLKHTGRILIDLSRKLMDEKRIETIIGEDGKEDHVQIDPKQAKSYERVQKDGKPIKSYNPTIGEFDVAVVIGPSYQTKQAEATQGMMEFAKAFPDKAPFVADLVAKNQPWPGSDTIAARLEMTLPPQMLKLDMEDMDPQTQAVIRAQQQQLEQASRAVQQLTAALAEKQSAQQLEEDRLKLDDKKTDLDFEAKMTKIAMDASGKVMTDATGMIAQQMNAFVADIKLLIESQDRQQAPGAEQQQAPAPSPGDGAMQPAMPGGVPMQ